MRTGKRLIKNRFYAAFYYNRLFRRNVESNDPYDARLNAIVIAAEQKKKKRKKCSTFRRSIISLENFCIKREIEFLDSSN